MEKRLPFLGHTELQILAVLGCLAFFISHAITVLCVEEKVLVSAKWVVMSCHEILARFIGITSLGLQGGHSAKRLKKSSKL